MNQKEILGKRRETRTKPWSIATYKGWGKEEDLVKEIEK